MDANLLVYAKVSDLPQHEGARSWLDERLNGPLGVGLPWPSLLAFVRLVSNPRVFDRPLPTTEAWEQVEAWLDLPPTWVPTPGERHRQILADLIPQAGSPRHVDDAHLAALALEYGLILQSTDRDFARFDALRWENPIG